MKKIIITSATILLSFTVQAQLAIGKDSVSSDAVSLEFGTENRGLLLPWVENEASVNDVVNGTMIYDAADKEVKVKYASGWKDLSIETGTTVHPISLTDGLSIQNNLEENADAKVSIGEPSLPAIPGILVLEDTNKAMVLPQVSAPHIHVVNPTAGLMVYDPTEQLLAVFNGEVWTYWKAQ